MTTFSMGRFATAEPMNKKAAALVPKDEGSGQSAAPAVLMERQDEGEQQEVVLDGSGTV